MTTPDGGGQVAVTQRTLDAVKRIGGHAASRGGPVSACPFDPAGDARQRALASAWMRGYLHRRPPAGVDYTPDGAAVDEEG